MIVGAGISGIQAALDLAQSGFKVFLVEKLPAIGGKMSQLDKTFPTNDCSMCIESPKFIECSRHPNIEILSCTDVERVEGEAGSFRVSLRKRPRYVIEDKCTGCNTCVQYCPAKAPDPFNQGMSMSKAIHIYFAQAVPLITYVDRDTCLYFRDDKCNICVGVCKNHAIDLHQEPERLEIEVSAIILSPGYEAYDPGIKKDYGYGIYKNVVTSLDFERLLCSTGPFDGEILRPSDHKHPRRIAWIQCVGSRRITAGHNSYCSGVCCTYTQKQVILSKDHDEGCECTVFHNDIRSFGKDFERFSQRAGNLPNVRFIRSFVSIGKEQPETNNITIRYAASGEGVKEEEFDLVVLSVAMNPPYNAEQLSHIFGIDLEPHSFCRTGPFNPVETSRRGIFISGSFRGPADIPESVVTASGAGAMAGALISGRRGRLDKKRVYPSERCVKGERPRIGVFVCHCGANIGRVVNVPQVVEYASTLPDVVHVQESMFACSSDNARQIAAAIREKGLNRVVVAACTPRTHEPLFRDTCREGGINPYLFEMANIREHCSWVHSKEPKEATRKAKEIVKMSVARAALLEPLDEHDLPVNKNGLVVGGGVAGMTACLSLAEQGFEVHLIESSSELGGMAKRIHFTLEGADIRGYLHELIRKIYKNPLIHVYHDAVITRTTGYVGNFTTSVKYGGISKDIHHGITIIATGAEEYRPTEYLYGENSCVVTNLELDEKIDRGDEDIINAKGMVMIQCVGCRDKERNYCSRVCCSHSIKNALKMKEINPDIDITILFRDIRTYGFMEDYYREAATKDVRFIRYVPEDKPKVEHLYDGNHLRVTVFDPVLEKELAIDADMVVLASAVIPCPATEEISGMFKLPLNPDGFFQEAHVKLRPVDFAAEGVFLCGNAHYPKHISETISQALGAAGRAATILSRDSVTASGAVCEVNEDMCVSCGACVGVCTYGAIDFVDTSKGQKARVNALLCKGDGLCNAKCPAGAISLKHFTDEEIFRQIDAAAT